MKFVRLYHVIYCVFFLVTSQLSSATCDAQLFRNLFPKKEAIIPVAFTRMPSQTDLLRHLESKNTAFRQLSCDLRISLDGAPKLRGTMQLELPKRLRIKAGAMGISGVDVGSNEEYFWVWSKLKLPNQRPAVFYAQHDAFENATSAIRQAIPLEPVWLLEGLGLIHFEASDRHILDPSLTPEGHLRMQSYRQTSTGMKARVSRIHPQQGNVLQQAVYDFSDSKSVGERIAYTNSKDYKSFPEIGISLPQTIEMFLSANGQQSKMVIELSNMQFDSLNGDPKLMWSMPQPAGVPLIDLTRQ